MPWRGNAVEHNPSNGQVGVVIAKAPHQGRQGCGLAAGFHHQQHRQTKAGGHCSAAAIGAGTHSVEQPHDPLHQGEGLLLAPPTEAAAHPLLAAEQQIKVAAAHPADPAQQLGIEIVGANLEALQSLPALSSNRCEQQRHQGLAAAAAGGCDQKRQA